MSISADQAERAREAVAYIKPRLRSATATMLEVGSKLLEVKADLEHGQFGAWIEAEFPFSIRSSQNYMKVAETLDGKSETVSSLPVSTVNELARASENARWWAVQEIEMAHAVASPEGRASQQDHLSAPGGGEESPCGA